MKNNFKTRFDVFNTNHFESNFRTGLVAPISNPLLAPLTKQPTTINQKRIDFIREVRNSAAHPDNNIRTKQEAEEYRKLVLDFFGFWCNHLK